jgi:hypothetical protein
VSGSEGRHAPRVKDSRITATYLTRQQLIESGCDIPWAEEVLGVLYEHPNGLKVIHVSYLKEKGGAINAIAENSFVDLRKAVADLNEHHRLENR